MKFTQNNVLVLVVVTLVLFAGCGSPKPKDTVAADPFDWTGKNCLVIVLDALTVNHLALWGYDRETTPNIDRLAKRGVVFKYARSQASSTPPSAYSYFSGKYPPLMLRPDATQLVELPDSAATFAEAFHAAGYDTGAFSGNLFVSPKTGFDQGFDEFELTLRHLPISSDEIELDDDSTTKLLAAAKTWIHAREANPWLCYLHILRPHNPYRAPDPLGSAFAGGYEGPVDGSDAYWVSVDWKPPKEDMPRLKDYYDGNLLYADALIGEFLDELEASGDLDDTAIIITSDHGEAFMEHGFVLHNTTVHEELIRVPLIVAPPREMKAEPRTVTQAVELVDLFPTMAALFGLESPGGVDGRPLLDLMNGGSVAERPMFAQDGDGDIMCVIEAGRKLVVAYDRSDQSFKPFAMFHLTRDPGETNNLLQGATPPRAVEMFKRATGYIDAHLQQESSQGSDLMDYEQEILETLGYL